jgi:hypothetical protein
MMYLLVLALIAAAPAIVSLINNSCFQQWILYGHIAGSILIIALITPQIVSRATE